MLPLGEGKLDKVTQRALRIEETDLPEQDGEIVRSMFEILEMQKIVEGEARVTIVPPKSDILNQLLAAQPGGKVTGPPPMRK